MKLERKTISLCPECLEEIPAKINVAIDGVTMDKTCPKHGDFTTLIEKDPIFYMLGKQLDRGNIYNGLFVDVSNECNTSCKYCYQDFSRPVMSTPEIIEHCYLNQNLAPFIMAGAEPTMREDLPELMRVLREIAPVMLTTNGLRLSDPGYVKSLDALMWPGVFNASVSIHPEANNTPGDYDKKMAAIDNIISMGMKLYGLVFVIDSLEQIDEVIAVNRIFKGHIIDTRMKIATEINQTGSGSELFNSDIYEYLCARAKAEGVSFDMNHHVFNKHAYFNMVFDGMNLTAVKWYTKHNVDLIDIDCGPWHLNRNGKLLNMDHSLILGG